MSRLPNFFIVGAPKCGTTALHRYLAEHPKIFMPEFKEPHFFAEDIASPYYIRSFEKYRALFAPAGEEHLAVGEASVWYLFSASAASKIRQTVPEAKLVVMFRNPVDLFVSFHNQALVSLLEDETDPEAAWSLQEARRRGERIPPLCDAPRLLQYAEVCRLGAQFKRLLETFPPSQVHPILLDDLVADPRTVYEGVLEFLAVPSDRRSDFQRVNEAYQWRFPWLETTRQYLDRKIVSSRLYSRVAPWAAPVRRLSQTLRHRNVQRAQKRVLSTAFRAHLTKVFAGDVELLSGLLGRDLSSWTRDLRLNTSPSLRLPGV